MYNKFRDFYQFDALGLTWGNLLGQSKEDIILRANIDGTAAGETLTGTADPDVINGFGGDDIIFGYEGDDTLDGGADNDIIYGGLGMDTMTGGSGADIFATEGGPLAETLSEYDGDTITDFTVDDMIMFFDGFTTYDNFVFTDDGGGGGTLDLGGGRVLNFENVAASSTFITVNDRSGGHEIHLYESGGLDFTIDADQFELVAELGEATILVESGSTIGTDPSGLFGATYSGIDLDGGTDFMVTNQGTARSIRLESLLSTVVNEAQIGENAANRPIYGVELSTVDLTTDSNGTITNTLTGTIYNVLGINLRGGNFFDASAPGMDNVTINNDGLIESTFNNIQGGTEDTLTINNTGTIRNVDGNFNSGLGMTASGDNLTTLNNLGVIEVLSTQSGTIYSDEGLTVSGGSLNGGSFNIMNSGRISSTGVAMTLGGGSDNDMTNFVNITNTATGIIESDTNSNGAEAAIIGTSRFVVDNTASATFEVLTQFNINNAGLIDGDITLYDQSFFQVEGNVFFRFENGQNFAYLSILGAPEIMQDVDMNGDPVSDGNGQPVFTAGTVTSTELGDVNYSVANGEATITDTSGNPFYLLPDADDIARGVFDDTVLNTGTIDGDINVGVGDDMITMTGTGNVTGIIYGELGDDVFVGANAVDRFSGGEGDDQANGNGGNDILYGGEGRDRLDGGAGNDILDGGDANDLLIGADGNDQMGGGAFSDRIYGGNGRDIMSGQNGNDKMHGGGGNDVMLGGTGNDLINGGGNSDRLYGGDNFDTLLGGTGGDLIDGGRNNDTLWGGNGNNFDGVTDTFVFANTHGTDTIKDFEDGLDLIDFTNHTNFNSFADVLTYATDDGTNLTIAINGSNTIIIENFTLAEMDASDFVF